MFVSITKRTSFIIAGLGLALIASGCSKPSKDQDEGAKLAGLTLLYAPNGTLTGEPNLYEFEISTEATSLPILKQGDLPTEAGILSLSGLPASTSTTIKGALYKDKFEPFTKTHSCRSFENFTLTSGEQTSVRMDCVVLGNDQASDPVQVFVKVASIGIELDESNVSTYLTGRDLNTPLQFGRYSADGEKVTLITGGQESYLHVGGVISYEADLGADSKSDSIVGALLNNEKVALTPVTGRQFLALNEPAELSKNGEAVVFDGNEGELLLAIPMLVANASQTVSVQGYLIEEAINTEFTVVSYNVENLFDQEDVERNQHYGDYRISPNTNGKHSNWSEVQDVDGVPMTFTDIKAANVVKALLAIDGNGPAVIGLQEIESAASLNTIYELLAPYGYQTAQFSEWGPDRQPNAIGMGIISKFPMKSWQLIDIVLPADVPPRSEPERPILKVVLDVHGHDLVVYNNHWKSKGGPEAYRKAAGDTLELEINAMLADNAKADYIILGDLNSEYNEKIVIEDRHNNTDGLTGINDGIRAQGDELATLRNTGKVKYNLHYERERAERRTGWHGRFGWSGMDHMIIGAGMYDSSGITYVDNSFQPSLAILPRLNFLFKEDGTTNRWKQERETSTFTRHMIGGYSDHVPIFARFEIRAVQSNRTIWIQNPGLPDATDAIAQ